MLFAGTGVLFWTAMRALAWGGGGKAALARDAAALFSARAETAANEVTAAATNAAVKKPAPKLRIPTLGTRRIRRDRPTQIQDQIPKTLARILPVTLVNKA